VAVRNVVAPAPQPEPASLFKCATLDVSFLRSDSTCRQFFCVITGNACREDESCLQVALSIAAFLEMLTKPDAKRATTATQAGCVQRGLGWNMLVGKCPLQGETASFSTEDDRRSNTLQLNTEGLTASKMSRIIHAVENFFQIRTQLYCHQKIL